MIPRWPILTETAPPPISILPSMLPTFARPYSSSQHSTISSSPYLQTGPEVGVDVSNIVTNSGVDTSVTSLSTTLTPGDSTLQNTSGSIDDWSTRVARAGILATCSISCTPHVGGNGRCTILSLARSTGDNWNRDLSQS